VASSELAKKKVLVVDDSTLVRQMICDALNEVPDMEVVGQARSGQQAIELLNSVQPDVITLDVQMPQMNGMVALEGILALRPVPVVMVSSLTQQGAATTFEALERGAIDYVPKPESGNLTQAAFREDLLRKVRMAAGTDVERILKIRQQRKLRRQQRPAASTPKSVPTLTRDSLADQCLAIGISTGGPPALRGLFEALQPPMPPIVVVQHMPPNFTGPLAWRLDSISALSVKEAETGDVLRPNLVLVAPGGRHLRLVKVRDEVQVKIFDAPPVSSHRPSVDVMMTSAAEIYGSRCLGVIMTGMGRDGVDGCRAIREAGGFVLGQDEATSDVYGMNKAAFVEGHVDAQFALQDAPTLIVRQVRRQGRRVAVH